MPNTENEEGGFRYSTLSASELLFRKSEFKLLTFTRTRTQMYWNSKKYGNILVTMNGTIGQLKCEITPHSLPAYFA